MLDGTGLKLVVSDIDGCLSVDKGIPFDPSAMAALREHQDRAGEGVGLPITLCSGRGQPYMEAIGQFLGITEPMICEAGSMLFDPRDDSVTLNPSITEDHLEAMKELRKKLRLSFKGRNIRFEIGKEICLSINPFPFPMGSEELENAVEGLLQETIDLAEGGLFHISRSSCSVDVTPKGVDKASGIAMLSERIGVSPDEMVGIGDSYNDLSFLNTVGSSACPNNAVQIIKDLVQYVSPERHILGVLDIIAHYSRV